MQSTVNPTNEPPIGSTRVTSDRRTSRLRRRFEHELALGSFRAVTTPGDVVRDTDLAELPDVVRRYFGFMRVVDHPRHRSFRAGFTGRFRLGPTASWSECEAWQYDGSDDVTRIFHMRTAVGGFVPTVVRDTYVDGRARMLARVFDLLPIVDVARPELDVAELVTYLNDAILFAPSMLLGRSTRWTAVDDRTFDVALTDRGTTVTARVTLDESDAPIEFSTRDRFGNDPYVDGNPFVRARWTTPIDGWTEHEGQPVMSSGSAVWHFEGGSFPYAHLRLIPGSFAFDVSPRG